ncbi:MAG: iron-sulfur cluster assembly scaffold protein [Bacteroidales bacterium]|jgi:NifU-like protein|nr:iron-sulfur cluster assembly scaffold protein [Bacteroidales bacterium]
MSKNSLIGGALWEEYSSKVSQRMDNPVNRGEITQKEAQELGARLIVADFGAESCGDAVRLFWAVDPSSHIVKAAKSRNLFAVGDNS